MAYVYGTCPCGGRFRARFIETIYRNRTPPVTLSQVPQGLCPSCDSRVYKAEVLEILESVMKAKSREEPKTPAEHPAEAQEAM